MGISFMVMLCFVWAGFMSAISFMESWLKFRASGVQLSIGLSIGRLIFKALNRVEWACFILIIVSGIFSGLMVNGFSSLYIIAALLALILIAQTVYLLPRMDARANLVMKGENPPKSRLHIYYVGFELIKLALLLYTGIGLLELL